nr:immunoglobulin light chain junction region [Macaca mulatta]
CQQGYRNPFTF